MVQVPSSIVCPFFKSISFHRDGSDRVRSLSCEGLYSGTTNRVLFTSSGRFWDHRHHFCESLDECKNCPYYVLANVKYL